MISAATRLYQSGQYMIGSDIQVDAEALSEVTDISEANVGAFVERFFELAPMGGEAWRGGWYLRSEDVANVISSGRHKISRSEVMGYIKHRLGINSEVVFINGKTIRCYKNIKVRTIGIPGCGPAEFGE